MKITFEPLGMEHQKQVMEIFNYYAEHSFAAFPGFKLPQVFFSRMLEKAQGYPAFALRDKESGNVAGFCFLSAFNPFSTFQTTAEISYFISPDYTGQGVGGICLARLEKDAQNIGVKTLLALISSKNAHSLVFHQKHGFEHSGTLKGIGHKFGEDFDVVIMQKSIL